MYKYGKETDDYQYSGLKFLHGAIVSLEVYIDYKFWHRS